MNRIHGQKWFVLPMIVTLVGGLSGGLYATETGLLDGSGGPSKAPALAQENAEVRTQVRQTPLSPVVNRNAVRADQFQGYDFGHVVERLEDSVDPLQREMDQSFKVFVDTVEESERLLEQGETRQAVANTKAALDSVVQARDKVLTPMWDGQSYLQDQIANVRIRLAKAVEAGGNTNGAAVTLNKRVEGVLDNIALRIKDEKDPLRHKRMVAHYNTVRNLAQIKRMADQLSPDQRKMWLNVLHVLDEAALAHQQVLMGSEVLFAQFESTATNLNEYLALMDTVNGAKSLLGKVRGLNEQGTGMTGFANGMVELQQRLAGFHKSIEQALQTQTYELEAQVDALAPAMADQSTGLMSSQIDEELNTRLARLTTSTKQ
ncbi:MAG: hypothetical protein JKX85_01235 [Phycisphaeraceae bacterium]|nr:hypothetical protein [Phycisphaeraceae bacterium]